MPVIKEEEDEPFLPCSDEELPEAAGPSSDEDDQLLPLQKAHWKKIPFPPTCPVIVRSDVEPSRALEEDTVEAAYMDFETKERKYRLKRSGVVVSEKQLLYGRSANVWVVPPGESDSVPAVVVYVRDGRSQDGNAEEILYSVQVNDEFQTVHHYVPSNSVRYRLEGSKSSHSAAAARSGGDQPSCRSLSSEGVSADRQREHGQPETDYKMDESSGQLTNGSLAQSTIVARSGEGQPPCRSESWESSSDHHGREHRQSETDYSMDESRGPDHPQPISTTPSRSGVSISLEKKLGSVSEFVPTAGSQSAPVALQGRAVGDSEEHQPPPLAAARKDDKRSAAEKRNSTRDDTSQLVGENTSKMPAALLSPLRASRTSPPKVSPGLEDRHDEQESPVPSKKRGASPASLTESRPAAKRRNRGRGRKGKEEENGYHRNCLVIPNWVQTSKVKECFNKKKAWLEKKTKCTLRLHGSDVEKNPTLPVRVYVYMEGDPVDVESAPFRVADTLRDWIADALDVSQSRDCKMLFMHDIAGINRRHYRCSGRPGSEDRAVYQRPGMKSSNKWQWMWCSRSLPSKWNLEKATRLLVGKKGTGVCRMRSTTGCDIHVCTWPRGCVVVRGDSLDAVNECRILVQTRVDWLRDKHDKQLRQK